MSQDSEQIIGRFEALRSRFDSLFSDVSLPDVSEDVSSLTGDIASLPGKIADVRRRGYAFASYLEHKAEVLQTQWEGARTQVQIALGQEAARLQGEVNGLRFRVDLANGMRTNPMGLSGQLPDLERAISSMESAVSAAKTRLEAMYTTLQNDTAQTLDQLSKINEYLNQWDEASFSKLAGEALFLAAKAEWVETGKGKDDPDGVIYLTDQRLIFEQKETTGKKLGLFGGKKTQELKWALPLNQITDVTPENKGFLGGKDMLNFTLGAGAPFPLLVVEVKGGVASKFWAAQIKRMIGGQTDDERAIQPDAETLEAIRKAPTACPSCGGTLPQLVANQRQTECPYCGMVVRV
jgi:hypothetical protein